MLTMVKASNDNDNLGNNESKRLEVNSLLVLRAAKMVYQAVGGGQAGQTYAKALQQEFERKRIRFRNTSPGISASSAGAYHCFENVYVEIKLDDQISQRDCDGLRSHLRKHHLSLGIIIGFGNRLVAKKVR